MKMVTGTQRCPPELLWQPLDFALPDFFDGRDHHRNDGQCQLQELLSGLASHIDDMNGLPDSLDWVRYGLHWAPPLLGLRRSE